MSWWRKKHFTKLSEILVFTQFAKPQLQKQKFIFWIMTTCFYTVHWGVPPQEVGREISSGPRPSSRERAVTWHWHYPTVAYDLDHTTTRLALHRGQYRTQQYWNCTVRTECSSIPLFKLLDISQDKKNWSRVLDQVLFFLHVRKEKVLIWLVIMILVSVLSYRGSTANFLHIFLSMELCPEARWDFNPKISLLWRISMNARQ